MIMPVSWSLSPGPGDPCIVIVPDVTSSLWCTAAVTSDHPHEVTLGASPLAISAPSLSPSHGHDDGMLTIILRIIVGLSPYCHQTCQGGTGRWSYKMFYSWRVILNISVSLSQPITAAARWNSSFGLPQKLGWDRGNWSGFDPSVGYDWCIAWLIWALPSHGDTCPVTTIERQQLI